MARLKIIKHFTLSFLGDAWKEAYIDFEAFSAQELKGNVLLNAKDPNEVSKSFDSMITLLESKFVSGKVPTDDGKLNDLVKEDVPTLPVDILVNAVSFLSQPIDQNLKAPSETS